MESTSFIDLKTPIKRDYTKYYLKRNPFPSIGVPEDTPLITVDRERVIKQFRQVVNNVIASEMSVLTVIVGEYGSGKSHLFKIFKKNTNDQLFSRQNGMIAVYIKNPGEEFLDFYDSFIDDLGRDFLKKLSMDVIFECFKEATDSEKRRMLINPNMELKSDIDVNELMNSLKYNELINYVLNKKFNELENRDMARAFLLLAIDNKSSVAWKWLVNMSLSKSDLDSMGITTAISNDNAYRMFLNLKKILYLTGIKYLTIFVDEMEKIQLLSKQKREKYQDDIRQLIDDNPLYTIIYIAIAVRQWNELLRETTALQRRLEGNWLFLDEFEEIHIQELLEKYLYTARTENFAINKIKHLNIKNPLLFPFTEDSVSKIHLYTEGVVSRILLLCRICLEYLCDFSDEYEVIDENLVEKAYSNR